MLRSEKDIRLRIDLLEGQSSAFAKILAKAVSEHRDSIFAEYSERLASHRGKIDELLWVLEEKHSQSILDLYVSGYPQLTVRQVIEKLRAGEITMEELPADAQKMVRKGAMEIKESRKMDRSA